MSFKSYKSGEVMLETTTLKPQIYLTTCQMFPKRMFALSGKFSKIKEELDIKPGNTLCLDATPTVHFVVNILLFAH